MAHYVSETKLSPAQILGDAIEFFGPNGWRLAMREQDKHCASFLKVISAESKPLTDAGAMQNKLQTWMQ
jgi:hypothetical protein